MTTEFTDLAVCYLARGVDRNDFKSFDRFIRSYMRFNSGVDHNLYVIFKGFNDAQMLSKAYSIFSQIGHDAIHVADGSFDIGAYVTTAHQLAETKICCLNTHSEFVCDNWLAKLASNLDGPGVGLVGATGSYESLNDYSAIFPKFPNPHIRSNAFLLDRKLFCSLTQDLTITNKDDCFLFESGTKSLTNLICELGLKVLVVGRNGRGYSPKWWPTSETFRLGKQINLLVGDNVTRDYLTMPWSKKHMISQKTWGQYINPEKFMLNSWKLR